ncbi:hypothetical protein Patl1_17123 [Pistacia atlantica]|uniref:Uncharacterized protein n=1 Tax=Pistacia atlantica TaxID=434234 RepID=A0ACC1B7L2_9ROSI|nr:hypothetical protein Patl1_17123 [Pistacia atlantica]
MILAVFKTQLTDTIIQSSDCCLWEGVECSNTTGRVIEIALICSGNPTSRFWHLVSSFFFFLPTTKSTSFKRQFYNRFC